MNIDSLIKYLNLNIKEFYLKFNSHINYPTMLSLIDTLNFYNIKTEVFEIENYFWDNVPDKFISLVKINNDYNFCIVEQTEDKNYFNVYAQNKDLVSKEYLKNNSQNYIIIFELLEEINTDLLLLKRGFYLLIILYLLIIYINSNLPFFIYNLLNIIGVFLSFEILKKKNGNKSLVNKFCKNLNNNDSCNKILQNKSINIKGLLISDLCLYYFVANSIISLFPFSIGYIKIISELSLIMIFYSLYVQLIQEKTICKICMIILSIIFVQFFISVFFFNSSTFHLNFFLIYLFFNLLILQLLFAFKLINDKNTYLKKNDIKIKDFVQNYQIFLNELKNSKKVLLSNNELFYIGNKRTDIHIKFIIYHNCNLCKEVIEIMNFIKNNYLDTISFQIRFNYSEEDIIDRDFKNLMQLLYEIYYQYGETEFIDALSKWYELKNFQNFQNYYSKIFFQVENSIPKSLIEVASNNFDNGLKQTPLVIINNFLFPEIYEISDLNFFIHNISLEKNIF